LPDVQNKVGFFKSHDIYTVLMEEMNALAQAFLWDNQV
jgi:hypothetical protein